MKHYMGIDPGGTGAIVVIDENLQLVSWIKNDSTEIEKVDFLDSVKDGVTCAAIEIVHSMPKQGVSSSFKFGQSYGSLRMGIAYARIRMIEASPQKWMKALGITYQSGLSKTEKKNILKSKAQLMFPKEKITLINADAFLLARYAMLNQ